MNFEAAGAGQEDDEKLNLPTEDEMRANVIRLAFYDDEALYQQFCEIVREAVPEAEAVVMRGSSVTGFRYRDNAPFDADGPGTSDLDLTLVGADVLRYYALDGYWIPGIHSRPLSEEDPDIAPELVPLRERLMGMVNRPVNIQGTRSWMQYLRGDMMGQPYLTMFGKVTE
ncbi:MAG TPA: hypothetical protein VEX68_27820 [Bryobacteraceae bacterium]|nr:hypothetical protein [Bryobacteraceae bacterium]